LKDPSDEMVLETAVNGNADYLATFNLRHLREAAALFGIKAVVPGEIWRKIRSEYEEE
jgi:predicted nucleic acid-binding protein